ncbi:MAG TPA: hypothetical protein VEZ55_03325 [Chitinophagaceae bacterium]|jgi:hypothetical protein|nr:hypothetical protein [Chitinophagaceae bacterium]
MEHNKDQFSGSQQGSGSAENTGRPREEQQQQMQDQPDQEQILRDLGRDSTRLASLKDMGSLSGRDDYAGGSGDQMSEENTNEETER